MERDIADPETKRYIATLKNEIAALRARNEDLEADYRKILNVVQTRGNFTIGDLTKLAIARKLHINKEIVGHQPATKTKGLKS